MQRVAAYIDGFNLYHSIDDLNYYFEGGEKILKEPESRVHYLKWVDLWGLCNSFVRDYQQLIAVNYYSAYAKWLPEKYARHQAYTSALETRGVRVVMAEFKERKRGCKDCGARWTKHEEKESDVRLATDLVADAFLDNFDDAFLITADSDIKPAIERVRADTPTKNVVVFAPPKRFSRARDLSPNSEVTKGRIAKYLLPEELRDTTGTLICRMPPKYVLPE